MRHLCRQAALGERRRQKPVRLGHLADLSRHIIDRDFLRARLSDHSTAWLSAAENLATRDLYQ